MFPHNLDKILKKATLTQSNLEKSAGKNQQALLKLDFNADALLKSFTKIEKKYFERKRTILIFV